MDAKDPGEGAGADVLLKVGFELVRVLDFVNVVPE